MSLMVLMPLAAETDAPSTQEMIKQLKSPRTRSLRNLEVESVKVPRPSLSLSIQFEFDSAQISPQSQQSLINLAQALQSSELAASRFAIEGHTDAKGSAQHNLRLSEERARAVRNFLVVLGIAAERMVVSGKGASELANPAQAFAAENRRVRIVNLD